MDLFPTICDLIGVKKPSRVEGLSLGPVLRGEKPRVRETLFTAYKNCQRSVTDDRWKLIRYPLINKTQLFDLHHDPHEEHDLSSEPEQSARIEQLMSGLAQSQQQYADSFPLVVSDPKPAAWSPALLTPADLKDQEEETAITFGKIPAKKAKKGAQ
jgi:arylsulfatase A-like enzyme